MVVPQNEVATVILEASRESPSAASLRHHMPDRQQCHVGTRCHSGHRHWLTSCPAFATSCPAFATLCSSLTTACPSLATPCVTLRTSSAPFSTPRLTVRTTRSITAQPSHAQKSGHTAAEVGTRGTTTWDSRGLRCDTRGLRCDTRGLRCDSRGLRCDSRGGAAGRWGLRPEDGEAHVQHDEAAEREGQPLRRGSLADEGTGQAEDDQ